MINIFILEDEILQQARLEKIIIEFVMQNKNCCTTPKVFGDPVQLLDAVVESGAHQLYFLDIAIRAEKTKGLQLAYQIRQKDPYATIVFVTTHSQFMPLTFKYKVAALDFIDKSLPNEEFAKQIRAAIEETLNRQGKTIAQDAFTFKTSLTQVQVPFNKILYFETSAIVHKVILHTSTERFEFYASMAEILKADARLYRCHKSFIVNPQNIVSIDKQQKVLYFMDGQSCLVAREKIKFLTQYLK